VTLERRRAFAGTATPPRLATRSPYDLWVACCGGLEPAETLHPRDREDLVLALWERGWTDTQIAAHTRMTLYTTARIRGRLELAPRQRPVEAVAS
jgi:hypothetical protein